MTTDNQPNVENAVRVLRAALEKGDIKFPGYIHIVLNALEEKERRLALTTTMLNEIQALGDAHCRAVCTDGYAERGLHAPDCWIGQIETDPEVYAQQTAAGRKEGA